MSPRRDRDEPIFRSYYGRPILKAPTWQAIDVAGYFFAGGLAGASSILAAGAQLTGRPRTARAAKVAAVAAVGASAAALVHDLGKPSRFYNMLRVVKPTSPMSVGSWLLAAYGPLAGAAAVSDLTGLLPGAGRAAGLGAGVLGAGVACYTGVLVADTAVPAWHEAYREMPYLFAGSAAAAASGLALIAAPRDETGPVRRIAVLGGGAELALTSAVERRSGLAGQTYRSGRAGVLLNAARACTLGGMAAAFLAGRSRALAAASGAALLAGSALTRFGVFEAGRASTLDPKYVVVPQRERIG